ASRPHMRVHRFVRLAFVTVLDEDNFAVSRMRHRARNYAVHRNADRYGAVCRDIDALMVRRSDAYATPTESRRQATACRRNESGCCRRWLVIAATARTAAATASAR